jgi:hypothetical protein
LLRVARQAMPAALNRELMMRGCFVAKAHNRVRSIPNGKEAGLCRRQHDYKIKMQLAFIAMAIGALPVRSCLPQYFGPKNTGEDCELADKKKNDNRVLHDLLLYRPDVGIALIDGPPAA